jgi:hypothetical protein
MVELGEPPIIEGAAVSRIRSKVNAVLSTDGCAADPE